MRVLRRRAAFPLNALNLSSSGVLFRTRQMLSTGTSVEIEIELNESYPAHATRARGRGAVVRYMGDESCQQEGYGPAHRPMLPEMR